MTAAERRRLLGADVIDEIHQRVAATPDLAPEDLDDLRRVLSRPAGRRRTAVRPTTNAA